nr:RecQ-mediated genome instability protein 1 [Tanacetum cinerariifolium]
MPSRRRRLRIASSSDEEEDDVTQPPQHNNIEPETLNLETVTLNSSNPNPNITPHSIHEISDEDFIDAFDNLSPPLQPQPTATSLEHSRTSTTTATEPVSLSDNPVSKVLEDLGLRLRGEWLDGCLSGLQSGVTGFSGFDVTKKAKMCFERFLESDMNLCGAGLLPSNVGRMHLVDLPGPFVLQVDEIVNISQPLRQRYKKANAGSHRCLKLSMTDGVQRVFGMEYQPIKELDVLAPAGLKVAISNVNVRHGLLMLVPEVFQVLGGLVEELDAGRQRLVTEVNKPPRGRRTRSGVVPPLATRATRAAWPAEDINVSRPLNNPAPQRATSIQVDDPGVRAARPSGGIHVSPPLNNPVPQRAPPIQVDDEGDRAARSTGGIHVSRPSNNDPQREIPVHVDGQGTRAEWSADDINVSRPSNNGQQRATPMQVDGQGTHAAWPADDIHVSRPSNIPVSHRATPMQVDDQVGTTPASVNERVSSNSALPIQREHVAHQPPRTEVESSFHTRRENIEPLPFMATTESAVPIPESVKTTPLRVTEEAVILIERPSPVAISDDEDVHMVAAEDNHFASGRSNESPFMYLATLSAKWAETKDQVAYVEGKIKVI